ncbi:MAG: hypothetical protein IKV94_00465 [Clostridia bacterium]|nr:hypothetical protein [Clostridia bacterium]
MSVYIILSFGVFLIVDYMYIYNFFDSKFLYISSGSKLKKVSNKKEKISFDLDINKILFLTFCSIVLWFLNFSIVLSEFNSNSLEITIFSKTLSLVSILKEKYSVFKFIYYISSYIFFCICCYKYRIKLLVLFEKLANKNKYSIQDTPSSEDKLITLGINETRRDSNNITKFTFSKYFSYGKHW